MLSSWANLYGAKYRDLPESRGQKRDQTQSRLQDAIDEEQARSLQLILADRTSEAQSAAEMARIEDENRQPEPADGRATDSVAQENVRRAEARARDAAAREAFRQAAERVREASGKESPSRGPERLEEQPVGRFAAAADPEPPQQLKLPPPQSSQERPSHTADAPPFPIPTTLVASEPQPTPIYEENPILPPRGPSGDLDSRENPFRPAWAAPRTEPAEPLDHRTAKEETLEGSRERLTSRWFALRSVFDFSSAAPSEPEPEEPPTPAPVIAVFSLAGGIGKTSLVATLGRALSARGERVLLVDTAAFGLMPFFFGAQDHRPGVLRTFSPPGTIGDSPIQMLALDPESLSSEGAAPDALVTEIGRYSRGVSRVIVDLATASGSTSRRVMKMAPMVLVPIIPDMNSVVSVSSIDAFFQHNQNGSSIGTTSLPFYVLNRYDPSLPLHLDIREVLREQLGDRLLPFALHRDPAVSEALAEGMTVMDYAPHSAVADDFGSLAGWVKNQSAPAVRAYRGMRWSER